MKVCNLFVSPNLQLCFSYKIICTYEATTSLLLRAVRLIKKKIYTLDAAFCLTPVCSSYCK